MGSNQQVAGPENWFRAWWRYEMWWRLWGCDRPVIWSWRRMLQKTRLVWPQD